MSRLQELISEGDALYGRAYKDTGFGDGYLSGLEYEKWIAKCIIFIEKEHAGETITARFIAASSRAVGNGRQYYDTMLGILKALAEMNE